MHIRETEAGCWEWVGHRSRGGYGKIVMPRTHGTWESGSPKSVFVHRVAYEVFVGPIPDGLHLDHLCRNRACCNPEHLEPVTNRENLLRGESFSAVNARKTECVNGHAFDAANTYVTRQGHRACRACARATRAKSAASRRLTQTPAPSPETT